MKMAMENVREFIGKLAADEALQAELRNRTAEDAAAAAAGMGFSFTKEELKEFVKGVKAVSPRQLDQAAGGNPEGFRQADPEYGKLQDLFSNW